MNAQRTRFASVVERETWGHVGVFDVVRFDGVTLVTFASRDQAQTAADELDAVYMVGRDAEADDEDEVPA